MVSEITCHELYAMMNEKRSMIILDVREKWERDICMLDSTYHIPLSQIIVRIAEIPLDIPLLIIICHHGVRSIHAGLILEKHGFKDILSLRGGIDMWSLEIEHKMKRY